MACPTCGHTMHALGCKVTDKTFFWCPRCGTIKPCEEREAVAPALVEYCRVFEKAAEGLLRLKTRRFSGWINMGIAESINLPENRPEAK